MTRPVDERRRLTRVVRVERQTLRRESLNEVRLDLVYELHLECGHTQRQTSTGRGGPSERVRCQACAAARTPAPTKAAS
jgi:hypothetical protein